MLGATAFITYILLSQDFRIVSESQYWLSYTNFRISLLMTQYQWLCALQNFENGSISWTHMNYSNTISVSTFIMYILLS